MSDLFSFFFKEFIESRRRYNKILIGGLFFAVFGYVYILEPYFSYQSQKRSLEITLKIQLTEVEKLEKKIKKLQKTISRSVISYEDLENRIDIFPYELAGAIIDFKEYFGSENREPPDPGITEEDYEYFKHLSGVKEAVLWYVDKWYRNMFKMADEEIIRPLNRTSMEIGIDSKNLLKIYNSTFRSFESYYRSLDENFWKDYDLIIEDRSVIAEKISSSFKQTVRIFLEEIKDYLDRFRGYLDRERIKADKLKEKINEVNLHEESLKRKLSTIDSPIGKLPVNLTDFIKTFPVIVSLITLIVYLNFRKIISLKQILISLSDSEDRLYKIYYLTDSFIFNRYYLILIFIVQLLIYLRSVYLILSQKDLFILITGNINKVEFLFYSVVYLAGFLFFIYILSMIISEKGLESPYRFYKDFKQAKTSS
ncbi:MAG TPA: hypothetical protein DEP48_05020 [Persephonella sp.]|uniref:Uncharacterized protein n=1 Tax=Persephonella marina (strain DSM 14350 / EX-H1) TaxID=123214 RepID=C0QPT9_PERMH|nr:MULTISPECIES: hypothetical protein [Persephonella]ACO04471.1 hypothetical protein PERMA_0897 [Persephonella marina EX-H1]HCB69700.1 hypothetical protein [Persephonella sp.]